MSQTFLVRRPFRANGRDYVTGDVFEGDAVHLRKLVEQRYLTIDVAEVPTPVPAPVVEKRGPGRPRKNLAADAASE